MRGDNEEMQWFAYFASNYSPLIRQLNEQRKALLLTAIDAYAVDGEIIELDEVTAMPFSMIKKDYDESFQAMKKRSKTASNNANKRYQKDETKEIKNDSSASTDKGMPLHTTACSSIQSNADNAQYNTEQYNTEQYNTGKDKTEKCRKIGVQGEETPCVTATDNTGESALNILPKAIPNPNEYKKTSDQDFARMKDEKLNEYLSQLQRRTK